MCIINPLYNLRSLFVYIDFSHAVVDLLRLCDMPRNQLYTAAHNTK